MRIERKGALRFVCTGDGAAWRALAPRAHATPRSAIRSGSVEAFCYFCGRPGPPGTPCPTCGIATPDFRAPDPSSAAALCPRCATAPLSPFAVPGAGPGITCSACSRCHGIFVTARSWCTLVATPDLAKALEAALPARAAAPSELLGLLACPVCRREMERGRFAASSNVVVDVCTMHGMWLDAGELGDVVRHASLRSRGGTPVALGEAVAQGEAMRQRLAPTGPVSVHGAPSTATPARSAWPLVVLAGVVVTLLGGLAAFRAWGMVRGQVESVPGVAASASADLK